jgi:hypothetical protein
MKFSVKVIEMQSEFYKNILRCGSVEGMSHTGRLMEERR